MKRHFSADFGQKQLFYSLFHGTRELQNLLSLHGWPPKSLDKQRVYSPTGIWNLYTVYNSSAPFFMPPCRSIIPIKWRDEYYIHFTPNFLFLAKAFFVINITLYFSIVIYHCRKLCLPRFTFRTNIKDCRICSYRGYNQVKCLGRDFLHHLSRCWCVGANIARSAAKTVNAIIVKVIYLAYGETRLEGMLVEAELVLHKH